MKFKLNEGVYLDKICNEYVLLASNEQKLGYKHVSIVDYRTALLISLIKTGRDIDPGDNAVLAKCLSFLEENEIISKYD